MSILNTRSKQSYKQWIAPVGVCRQLQSMHSPSSRGPVGILVFIVNIAVIGSISPFVSFMKAGSYPVPQEQACASLFYLKEV